MKSLLSLQSQNYQLPITHYILLSNPSCDLPKEVDGTSQDKESDFEFKPSGGDRMNGFG
jgi:hypothetical protein